MTIEDEQAKARSQSEDTDMIAAKLPIRLTSTVIRGFGRGSTELGIPTANLNKDDIGAEKFADLSTGIYYGVASIGPEVYKAAISIGYNPTYKNKEKTVEPHLIAKPDSEMRKASICGETQLEDFYGKTIKLSVVGFIRPEVSNAARAWRNIC